MNEHELSEQSVRYAQARLAVVGKIDYWKEIDNPELFSAFKICQELASENYGKANYLLSRLYDAKRDGEGNKKRANHFEKLAFDWCHAHQDKVDAELWCDLGCLYQAREIENNFELAAFWFRKAADLGYAEAQYTLADAYRFGLGVTEDLSESLKWCQQAADQGHAMALANLGHMKEELAGRYNQ